VKDQWNNQLGPGGRFLLALVVLVLAVLVLRALLKLAA
jgi:hypothetical protein